MPETQSNSEQSYSFYELRAIYATGATIEQLLEGTAPTDADETALRQFVADATGRMAHDIDDLEIVASSEREHVADTSVLRTGQIQLGGV